MVPSHIGVSQIGTIYVFIIYFFWIGRLLLLEKHMISTLLTLEAKCVLNEYMSGRK